MNERMVEWSKGGVGDKETRRRERHTSTGRERWLIQSKQALAAAIHSFTTFRDFILNLMKLLTRRKRGIHCWGTASKYGGVKKL